MIFTNPFTSPSLLTVSSTNLFSNFNNLVTGLYSFVTGFQGLQKVRFVASSGNVTYNMVANRDVYIEVDASFGDVTINLCPAASHTNSSVRIKKIDNSDKLVTITRNGSDTIEDPQNPLLSPTATTYILSTGDELVELVPNATISGSSTSWRIADRQRALWRYAVKVIGATFQTLSPATFNKINWTSKTYDYNNNFDLSTDEYTCPYTGIYDVRSSVSLANTGGGAKDNIISLFLNGSEIERGMRFNTATGCGLSLASRILCQKGDKLHIGVRVEVSNSSTEADGRFMWASFALVDL